MGFLRVIALMLAVVAMPVGFVGAALFGGLVAGAQAAAKSVRTGSA